MPRVSRHISQNSLPTKPSRVHRSRGQPCPRTPKQNRRLLQDYLRSHPCVDCGETDIVTLQFDHRDRATKRKEVALLVVQTAWSIVQTEIAKCDVRCANCHRRRTALQLGWRRLDGARTSVRATLIEAEIFPRKSGVRLCTGC